MRIGHMLRLGFGGRSSIGIGRLVPSLGTLAVILTGFSIVSPAQELTQISRDSSLTLASAVLESTDSGANVSCVAPATSHLITMVDSTTAFLSDTITGRIAWLVEVSDHVLRADQSAKTRWHEQKSRTYDVYIDASTGNPIKVVSRIPGFDEGYWFKPTAEQAAEALSRSLTYYVDLPSSFPRVTLTQALAACDVNPFSAEEIVAIYLTKDMVGKPPLDVWEIYFYGVDGGIKSRPWANGLPRWFTEFWCVTIDATTGSFVTSSNSPGPYPDPEGAALIDSLIKKSDVQLQRR